MLHNNFINFCQGTNRHQMFWSEFFDFFTLRTNQIRELSGEAKIYHKQYLENFWVKKPEELLYQWVNGMPDSKSPWFGDQSCICAYNGTGQIPPTDSDAQWVVVDGLYLAQGGALGLYYLCSILDDCSRYILVWQLCIGMSSEEVKQTIEAAIRFISIPSTNFTPLITFKHNFWLYLLAARFLLWQRGAHNKCFVIYHFHRCPLLPVFHRIPDTYLPTIRGEYILSVSLKIIAISTMPSPFEPIFQ